MSSQVYAPVLVMRKSCCEDVDAMIPLMRQLRYPTTPSVLKERLSMMEDHPTLCSLVAELDGVVVATVFLELYQTHDMKAPVTCITALVVDEQHRRARIGERLIREAEIWGKERGSSELFVSIARENGSKSVKSFYEQSGFTSKGYHLTKTLS